MLNCISKRSRTLILILLLSVSMSWVSDGAQANGITVSKYTPPPGAPGFSPVRCSKYIFVGLKGSGESGNKFLGERLTILYAALQKDPRFVNQIDSTTLLSYNAANVSPTSEYYDVVSLTGSTHLYADFAPLAKECGDSYFLFVGYSQGAYLLHQFLKDIYDQPKSETTKKVAARILGAYFLADPGQAGSGILTVLQQISIRYKLLPFNLAFSSKFSPLNLTSVYSSSITNLSNILIDSKQFPISAPLINISTPSFRTYYPGDVVADTSTPIKILLNTIGLACLLPVPACIDTALESIVPLDIAFQHGRKIHTGYKSDMQIEPWVRDAVTFFDSHVQ